ARRIAARRDGGKPLAVDLQRARDGAHQQTIDERPTRLEAPIEIGVGVEGPDVSLAVDLVEIGQEWNSDRSRHRSAPQSQRKEKLCNRPELLTFPARRLPRRCPSRVGAAAWRDSSHWNRSDHDPNN